MFAEGFPKALGSIEGAWVHAADLADRVILGGGRFLADQRSFAIPRHVVGASPTVPAPHPLAILECDVGVNIVVQAPYRPAMMRFARGILHARLALEKDIRTAHTRAHHE